MVIDSSALIAIIRHEPTRAALLTEIAARTCTISAVSLLETGVVLRGRFGADHVSLMYQLIDTLAIAVAPFDDAQSRRAIAAFARFGKGMGHPAQLNFGDCAVYALASLRAEPVLALGADFSATDLSVIQP